MFVLPPVGLIVGWLGWDLRTGVVTAALVFALMFLTSGIILATAKDPSWFVVMLPFLFGLIYALLPDVIPGPIDDAAAVAAGAILSFTLWLRKQPETPKWIIFPWLAASLYTLVGNLIPAPVDELIVYAISIGASVYGMRRVLGRPHSTESQGTDFIEG